MMMTEYIKKRRVWMLFVWTRFNSGHLTSITKGAAGYISDEIARRYGKSRISARIGGRIAGACVLNPWASDSFLSNARAVSVRRPRFYKGRTDGDQIIL
jgi:hypothetical protein